MQKKGYFMFLFDSTRDERERGRKQEKNYFPKVEKSEKSKDTEKKYKNMSETHNTDD